MALLPFFAGKEIPEEYLDEYFFNRERELKELLLKLTRKPALNIALYGQRRLGKTSLMEKLKKELKKKNCFPILVKCEQLIPLEPLSFLQNLALVLINEYAKIKKITKIKEVLKEQLTKAKIGLEISEITFWLEFGKGTVTLKQAMDKCFSLIRAIEKTCRKKAIILLDEFQEIFSFGDEFLWALRAHISDSPASFVVSSSWHRFKDELNNKDRPFFNFFDAYEIGSVNEGAAREYLISRIRKFKMAFPPSVVEKILEFSECKPYYLQHLALNCYTLAVIEKKKIIGEEIYHQALKEVIKNIPAHLISQFKRLVGHNRDVFVAMCLFDLKRPTGIAEKTKMEAKDTVIILRRLTEAGLVEKNGSGNYKIADKFLKEYVKQEFTTTL